MEDGRRDREKEEGGGGREGGSVRGREGGRDRVSATGGTRS